MFSRSTTRTVVFRFPFELSAVDGALPAGSYEIQTEEELIPGLSFEAYRRISTTISLDTSTRVASSRQIVSIDPAELELALKRDASSGSPVESNNVEE